MSDPNSTDQTQAYIASLYQINQDTPDLPGTQRLNGIPERFQRIQQNRILQLRAIEAATALNKVVAAVSATGTPLQVTGVSATESPFKTQAGMMLSNVSVSFTVDPTDLNFAYAQVWFTGYNGSSVPQLISQSHGSVSPVSFLVDTTGETPTVTVVAIGLNGTPVDFASAPTTTVVLDGVISAPPAPTVVQTALPIYGGVQFAFQEEAGLLADVIQCYKVYRNIINNSGSVLTGNTTNASVNVTALSSTTNLQVGMVVTGSGIPSNTSIASVVSSTAITLSQNATITHTGTSLTFSPLVIQNIPHNPQNAGTNIVVQDSQVFAQTTYFYWVSAINTTGLESTLTSAGSSAPSLAMPSIFQNLFGNPDMLQSQASGTPSIRSINVVAREAWEVADTANAFFQNGREIRILAGVNNTVGQFKATTRFEPNTILTMSFSIRRGGLSGSPTGTYNFGCALYDSNGTAMSALADSGAINISTLSATSYTFKRIVMTLPTPIGGQSFWFFQIQTAGTPNDDIFVTKPMLNVGPDSSPYTATTFLTDVPAFCFDGVPFVSDDFTEAADTAITAHRPTAGGGAPTTGLGGMWEDVQESGTGFTLVSGSRDVATLSAPTGATNQTNQVFNVFPQTNGGGTTVRSGTLPQVSYAVQADVNLGTATATIQEAGVLARAFNFASALDFSDQPDNNFYLARLLNNGGTVSLDLFKRFSSPATYTQIGTFAPGAISSGTIKLQVTDAAKIVFLNGVQRISSADTSIPYAGVVGFRLGFTATAVTTAPSVDNFSAFWVPNLASVPTPPVNTPTTPPPPPTYDPTKEPTPIITGGGNKGNLP